MGRRAVLGRAGRVPDIRRISLQPDRIEIQMGRLQGQLGPVHLDRHESKYRGDCNRGPLALWGPYHSRLAVDRGRGLAHVPFTWPRLGAASTKSSRLMRRLWIRPARWPGPMPGMRSRKTGPSIGGWPRSGSSDCSTPVKLAVGGILLSSSGLAFKARTARPAKRRGPRDASWAAVQKRAADPKAYSLSRYCSENKMTAIAVTLSAAKGLFCR